MWPYITGSGAFGSVCKAEALGIVTGELVSTVAVKMTKPNSDLLHHKILAAELKVMCHIGQHSNIVNLLGACTKDMGRGEA